jgi:hypothetical protein
MSRAKRRIAAKGMFGEGSYDLTRIDNPIGWEDSSRGPAPMIL